ncbi:hypothetical protein, partial [Streptomyces sp. NPDC006610]|uniref:hypothetical protein n=1 Tax=Streptomyces sp. NPDC006610 TaxID=3154584 RepID=UPI0033B330E2
MAPRRDATGVPAAEVFLGIIPEGMRAVLLYDPAAVVLVEAAHEVDSASISTRSVGSTCFKVGISTRSTVTWTGCSLMPAAARPAGAVSARGTPYLASRSGIRDSTGALRRQ